MYTVMKRAAAHAAGLRKYFTGKPCAKGHNAQRWTASGICCVCASASTRKYNQKMRGGNAVFTVNCHKGDEESIRQFVAGLAAIRDARDAASIERHGDVQSPFADKLALLPPGVQSPAFTKHPGAK